MRQFARETSGQDLIEYALLAGTIALGVAAAMAGVRAALNTQFSNISTTLTSGS
jgi:pilus assembly protein Flp/PilA